MNQSAFHEAIRKIANGEYFSTSIDVTEYSPEKLTFKYKAYLASRSWVEGPTGESVIFALLNPLPSIDALDTLPSPPAMPSDIDLDRTELDRIF